MRQLLCLFFFFSIVFSPPLAAQVVLLFPESTEGIESDLPDEKAVQEAEKRMQNLSIAKSQDLEELRALGRKFLRIGKHEEARSIYDKILQLHQEAYGADDLRSIEASLDLCRAYVLLIRYEAAHSMLQEALSKIQKQQGLNSKLALVVETEILQLTLYTRDFRQALRLGRKLEKQLKTMPRTTALDKLIVLNNYALALQGSKKEQEALASYAQAAALGTEAGIAPSYQLALLSNYALALAEAKQSAKARELLEKLEREAKAELPEKKTHHARIWMQVGAAWGHLGDFRRSELALLQGLVLNSLSYNSIENVAAQSRDLLFNNQYLAICAQAGTFMTLSNMYEQNYFAQNDKEALRNAYSILRAMSDFEADMQGRFSSEQDKLTLFQLGASQMLHAGIRVAQRLYQYEGKQSYLDEAFNYSERNKSTLLLHALRSRSEEERLGELPRAIREQEKLAEKERSRLQTLYMEAKAGVEKQKLLQALNREQRKIEELKAQIRKEHPQYYKHQYQRQLSSIAELQAGLDAKTALLSYSLGPNDAFAFVISKEQAELKTLHGHSADFLQQRSATLRQSLSDYQLLRDAPERSDSLFRSSATELYEIYLAPLLDNIDPQINRLILIPDAELAHLPFEVLLSEQPHSPGDYASYPYLMRSYALAYSYSASLHLQSKQRKVKPKEKGVLAFAAEYQEPVYANALLAEKRRGLSELRRSLDPLPGALREVELMQDYLLGSFFQGAQASEANFKSKASDYNIIHLAMHGLLHPQRPILSSMVFSEDEDMGEDNFLYAYEIARLNLQANLVVLSACETGFGKYRQGEGVMSLAYAFSYAGAKSSVMSLWQVNDVSTARIMELFYRNLAQGYEKDYALQKAKLSFLNSQEGQFLHPAYWSAFVLSGDREPIELFCSAGLSIQKTSQWLRWGAGALGLLSLLALAWFWKRKRRA